MAHCKAKLMPTAWNLPRLAAGRRHRASLGFDDRTNVLDQLLVTVGFGEKTAQATRQHSAERRLFAKAAAQHNLHIGIDRLELIEDRITVDHREKIIENDERDFFSHAPINPERFDAILGSDDTVILKFEHRPGQLEELGIIIDYKNEFTLALRINNWRIARVFFGEGNFADRDFYGDLGSSSGRGHDSFDRDLPGLSSG